MTPDQIQKELEPYGVSIGRSTLTKYARQGIIGEPTVRALGRGLGKLSQYPEETPAEIVAARLLVGATLIPPITVPKDKRVNLFGVSTTATGGIGPKVTLRAIGAVRRFAYNTKAGELSSALKKEGAGDAEPLLKLIGHDWNPIWFFDLFRDWAIYRAWVLRKLPEPPRNLPYPTVERLDELDPEQAVIALYDT